MPITTEAARIARVRRRAATVDGLSVVKVRASSPDFEQYGPFMLVEPNRNSIEASGYSLDSLERDYDLA